LVSSFLIALNNLLLAGVEPQDIFGATLLDEIKRTTFEGVTGQVSYDSNSDRKGNFDLLAVTKEHGSALEAMGVWSAVTDGFDLLDPSGNVQWVGDIVSNVAPPELTACELGWVQDETTGLCAPCPQNWFTPPAAAGSVAVCVACNAGTVGNEESAATSCINCGNGTYRGIQDANCTLCPPGTFSSTEGKSACEACPIGRFTSQPGQSECAACGADKRSQALFATMSRVIVNGKEENTYLLGAMGSEACTCDFGARKDEIGECVPCTEGMECLGMNDVRVLPGYYAATPPQEGSLSIFRCIGDGVAERCIGGLPGDTCALNRHGVTCASCLQDTVPTDDGPCVECVGSDYLPLVVVTLIGCVVLVCTYHTVDKQNRATQSHAFLLGTIAAGQFITMMQHLVVLGRLNFDFQNPIKWLLEVVGIFAFDIKLIRLQCVGTYTPLTEFSLKVFFIFVLLIMMSLIHAVFVVLRHHGRFRKQRHSLVGVIGTLLMVFYISVTAVVLEPIQCLEHPNGKWTMRTQPSVVCWEAEDHSAMLVIGLFAFLCVPVLFLVGAAVVVRQVPVRMRAGDVAFLKSFTFLFFRFRPEQHTYALLQLIRSFLVALVLAIPDAVVQAFTLEAILLMNYTAILAFWPWRVHEANMLDCFLCGGTVLVIFLVSFFLEESEKRLGTVAWFSTVVCAGVLSLIPVAIGVAIYNRFFRSMKRFQFFLCHHKAGAGAYVRLLKLHLIASPKVTKEVFLDSDNLDNLDYLFEYVANDTDMFVAVVTRDIFTRPWCIGELCTARLGKIQTTALALQGSRMPDEEFISDFVNFVESMEMLTESGMTMDLLQDTLRWIGDQPRLSASAKASDASLMAVVERLTTSQVISGVVSIPLDGATPIQARSSHLSYTPMVYDLSNSEAAASAYILRRMLIVSFANSTQLLPSPVEKEFVAPRGPCLLVILCTNGIFSSEGFRDMVSAQPLSSLDPTFLPLIGEQGFRFPSLEMRHTPSNGSAITITSQNSEGLSAAVQEWIRALFKEIAVSFLAQTGSEQELQVAAEQIARRLRNLHVKSTRNSSMRYRAQDDDSAEYDVREPEEEQDDAESIDEDPDFKVIKIQLSENDLVDKPREDQPVPKWNVLDI